MAADGTEILCTWWEAALAPREGSRVAVVGEGWRDGSLSVRRTRVVGVVDQPFEHRLLDYYQACLEAEQAADEELRLGRRSTLVLAEGPAPHVTSRSPLPTDRDVTAWVNARRVAGEAETILAGWPLITTEPDSGRGSSPLVASLLVTEVRVVRADEHAALEVKSSALELNPFGLTLLGVTADERQEILDAFDLLDLDSDPVVRVDQCVQFFHEVGVIEVGTLDPGRLEPIGQGQRVHNCVLVYVSGAGQSAITRALFQDFDSLRASPLADLRSGPLGIALGHAPPGTCPEPRPTPAVLPSNLEQERGITAAMTTDLTVITGPPGTGKSQVLANTVASALAAGETVLLASKNNHAIDVVVDRVRGAHPDATPVRMGKADLRSEAARTMGQALARPTVEDSGLDAALAAWAVTKNSVAGPYDQIQERGEVLRQVATQRDKCDRAARQLPESLRRLAPEVEADLLLVSHQAARRLHKSAEASPNRWFWQRRRHRQAQELADQAAQRLIALAGEPANTMLTTTLVESGRDALIALVGKMLTLDTEWTSLDQLQLRLNLLPTTDQAERQIESSFSERLGPANDLFGAEWRHRLRRQHAPGRPAAVAYQARLADVARTSSGAGRLRPDAAGAIEAFPVWAITSLSAGSSLPLVKAMFDVVIIDEASQSDVPSALPLLYRAKRAVILGDPRQLNHITTVGARTDAALAERYGVSAELAYTSTSLFALAASRSIDEPIFLRRHFRSHPDIIGFSNQAFYGGRLIVETDPARFLDGSAVRWRHVTGRFERNTRNRSALNKPEAEAVLDELATTCEGFAGSAKTIGIVSPFRAQVDLLRDLVVQRFPDLVGVVTVDTAHGFQGDERDVMILSPVVADGMTEFLIRHAGDPNVVNVAVTRARARLVIVGDHNACLRSETVLAELARYTGELGRPG